MKFIDHYLKKNSNRIVGLDIVRSMAILLVVYGHSSVLLPLALQKYYLFLYPFLDGVSIFFVLSGFLIGGILLRTIENTNFTSNDLFRFWIRRWFRTLPNYYFILIALVLITCIVYSGLINIPLIKYLFFAQNLFSKHPLFFTEAWSLCVEEWFYLLFPLAFYILFKLLKHKKASFLITTSFFLIIPLLLRLIKYKSGIDVGDWDESYRKIVIFRLDSLMYGILGAYFYYYKNEYWKKIKYISLLASFLIILILTLYYRNVASAPINYFFLSVFLYNLESIAVFLALPYFSELKNINFKYITFFFTFISIISYSMYLLNFSIIEGVLVPQSATLLNLDGAATSTYFIKFFLFWFYLIIGSYLLNELFEKPIMNLRDKIKRY